MQDGAFTALCAAEYPVIVGALTLWCNDRSVAEEVTAEAFARAYRDWHRVRRLESPGGWVRRVALNLATSRFRRGQAERRVRHRLTTSAREVGDPDRAEAMMVRDALQQLRVDHRTVLVLRYFLDLPISEVAALMGRTPTGVTSLTARAADAFRAVLAANGGGAAEVVRHDR